MHGGSKVTISHVRKELFYFSVIFHKDHFICNVICIPFFLFRFSLLRTRLCKKGLYIRYMIMYHIRSIVTLLKIIKEVILI